MTWYNMGMEIVGAFFGSLAGCFIFRYLEATRGKQPKKPPVQAPVMTKEGLKTKKSQLSTSKPQGSIVHAPTPEEERVQKQKDFEKKVYPKEEVSEDYR